MKFTKKLLSVVMAAATLMVGAANVSAAVCPADGGTVAGIIGDQMEPRYVKHKTFYFNVAEKPDEVSGGPITVSDAPVKIAYHHCSAGCALLSIYINGSRYQNYVIPEYNYGGEISNMISDVNIKAGDTITYKVTPYKEGGYDRAVGSFTIYY